jgi:hypothetical protein
MRWLANSHILTDREMRLAPTLSRAVGPANRSDEQRRIAQIGIAKRGLPERRIRQIGALEHGKFELRAKEIRAGMCRCGVHFTENGVVDRGLGCAGFRLGIFAGMSE